MPLKYSVLEASKLVSTKTPPLKHYDRSQGKPNTKTTVLVLAMRRVNLVRGNHPNFEKRAPRIWAEILASNQFRESLRE